MLASESRRVELHICGNSFRLYQDMVVPCFVPGRLSV